MYKQLSQVHRHDNVFEGIVADRRDHPGRVVCIGFQDGVWRADNFQHLRQEAHIKGNQKLRTFYVGVYNDFT